MFPLCLVCAKEGSLASWVPGWSCPYQQGSSGASASHAAILLPGFVRHGGVRGVQGRGEGAQEASQQREAQSTPGAEHGPAIPVADVLRYPEHVARVAGQFEIDASHARAQGDYAACSCQKQSAGQISAAANVSIWSGASFHHIVAAQRHTAPSWWLEVLHFVENISPPMRKRSPATYCIKSCSLQQPSMPMIHPNRMIDMAMPMKLAVILLRSAKTTQLFDLTTLITQIIFFKEKKESKRKKASGGTHGVRATRPALLSSSDWLADFWAALMMSSSILLACNAEPIL